MIISNYHKSSKIKQLYKVSMRKNIISLIGPPSKHQLEEYSYPIRSGLDQPKYYEDFL